MPLAHAVRDTWRAMTGTNVELARRYCDTFNADGLDGAQQWWHPEIEVYDPPEFPDASRYVGVASLRKAIQGYLELGWDGQWRVEEYLDAGDEVVVVWRMKGRSPLGGLPLDEVFAYLFLFEDGKLRRVRQYLGRDAALEASGLLE